MGWLISIYNPGILKPVDSNLKVEVGQLAPDFTLRSIRGKSVTLSQYSRDKVNHYRVDSRFESEQNPDLVKEVPYVLTTGRMVEHMGAGAETRSNQ